MKSLSFLILSVLMICSCSNKDKKDSKLTENQVKNQAKKSKLEKNFLGIWRIDSIGENNKVTHRLISDSTHYQTFFFTFDYKIMVCQNKGQVEKRFMIGDFKVEDDSVFFIEDKYNKVAFRYKYEFFGNKQLKLSSGTSVSETNRAKPLLFLKKVPNERSMKTLKILKGK